MLPATLPHHIADKPWLKNHFAAKCSEHANNHLAHAQLFTGPNGTGQNQLALALAEVLLCVSPGFPKPCGNCHGCKLSETGNHPDLLIIKPLENKTAIGIDQIRNIGEQLAERSHQGVYRVVLINNLESLTIAASNALLKMLEEPPDNTFFLTTSSSIGLLLPTVRSRLQAVHISSPGKRAALEYLHQTHSIDREEAENFLNYAENAPLRTADLLKNNFSGHRNFLFGLLAMCFDGNSGSTTGLARSLTEFSAEETLNLLLAALRDIMILSTKAEASLYFPDKLEELQRFAEKIDNQKLYSLYDQIMEIYQGYRSGIHLNAQLQLQRLAQNLEWLFMVSKRSPAVVNPNG